MAQDDQNLTEKDFNETTTNEDSVFNEEFYQELNAKDRYSNIDEEEDVEDMGTPNTSTSLTDETDEDIE